jgi:hypothetical protein
MNPSGSQGTQCVHQDFLRVIDTDTYQQSASMCVYRTTQDGSRGLTFMIYFKFCRDDATRESYVAALFDCFSIQNIWVILTLINKKLAPDGSNDAY